MSLITKDSDSLLHILQAHHYGFWKDSEFAWEMCSTERMSLWMGTSIRIGRLSRIEKQFTNVSSSNGFSGISRELRRRNCVMERSHRAKLSPEVAQLFSRLTSQAGCFLSRRSQKWHGNSFKLSKFFQGQNAQHLVRIFGRNVREIWTPKP
jgi:hypothetical protein